jgi:hypothetical protein
MGHHLSHHITIFGNLGPTRTYITKTANGSKPDWLVLIMCYDSIVNTVHTKAISELTLKIPM